MDKKTIIGAIVGLSCAVFGFCFMGNLVKDYKEKLEMSEQNIIAYKNNIQELELKNGELVSVRDSYILKNKELEEMFDLSKKEVKELEKRLGDSMSHISKLEPIIKYDTIETTKDTIIYKNMATEVKFSYNDEWLSFNGSTNIHDKGSLTKILDLTVKTPIIIGITDNYKLFAKSPNPYVEFTSIESAMIEDSKMVPKKDIFSWGLQLGVGGMYDIIDRKVAVGPYLGLGVQINF